MTEFKNINTEVDEDGDTGQNQIFVKAEAGTLECGTVDKNTGEIVYSAVCDAETANKLDQDLQFAMGIGIDDILQNGATVPYIDKLIEKFESIKIELW